MGMSVTRRDGDFSGMLRIRTPRSALAVPFSKFSVLSFARRTPFKIGAISWSSWDAVVLVASDRMNSALRFVFENGCGRDTIFLSNNPSRTGYANAV
jgi:hypothetical protein